ncbi:putative sugar O-methyltransferase [Marinibaculum pumilum]|uniref:Sugar O-methyltransferase n=1 Tax=Marinibaculum pumilum TaxID=1766165 RepID=A0ABV7KXW4_9PROT
MDKSIDAMDAELLAGPEIYHPSRLWQDLNRQNTEQLRRGGIENFKRSINQNYFNFLPLTLGDAQLFRLMRDAVGHGRLPLPRSTMRDPDLTADGGLLPAKERIFNGRRGWRKFLYRTMVDLLWDHVARELPDDRLRQAAEPEIGNPIDLRRDGRLISQDLAHSFLEWRTLAPVLAGLRQGDHVPVVAEVGAGYGRLASALLTDMPVRYWIFDVPPALYVSQWYLGRLFPGLRQFRFRPFDRYQDVAAELAEADIAFFTVNQIEAMPGDAADVAVNISSLHEFKPRQIDNTLRQMARLARAAVYLKQYKTYVNPADRLIVQESAYRLPEGWQPQLWRTDTADPRFFEAVFAKAQGSV